MRRNTLLYLACFLAFDCVQSSDYVTSCFDDACTPWLDDDGNKIEAHAAGLLQTSDGTFYWYGESEKTTDLTTHGVNCYSAPGLGGPWHFAGEVLSQEDISVDDAIGPWVVERPKVLYNDATDEYVMWFHLDTSDYQYRHAGVATSKTPGGPFAFAHALQPDGLPSLDLSLFKDPLDGTAYFIRSCDNAYAGISRLTPDYLNTSGVISTHDVFEGMALFRLANGTYYIVTSHLTGWDPNPLMLFRAAGATLDDPQWVDLGNPTGDSSSFNSQPTFVVQLSDQANGGAPYFMYMGDNWVHGPGDALANASYVWLPFEFGDESVQLEKLGNWSMADPFAGCPACDEGDATAFPLDLTDKQCTGLREQQAASTQEACRSVCCRDPSCNAWQWCAGNAESECSVGSCWAGAVEAPASSCSASLKNSQGWVGQASEVAPCASR